jgi:glycosyltransferase involved in cell wall biosynthesis
VHCKSMPLLTPPLTDLPTSPSGRIGWPWTEEAVARAPRMPNGDPWPPITIVTPSFNQAQYLEQSIRSVLLQGYPNLQYVIIDGNSSDNSVDIIHKYAKFLDYWVSEPDSGQAEAILKGLGRATGEWFNWINSDDILLPNALYTLATIVALNPTAQWISGGSIILSEDGSFAGTYIPWRTDPTVIGLDIPSFPQDATFIRTTILKSHGQALAAGLNNVFDTLLYFELTARYRPLLTTALFSGFRFQPNQKTANESLRAREYNAVISPIMSRYPLLSRIFFRCLRTRFGRFLLDALRPVVWYGLTRSSRQWTAATYSFGRCSWELQPARRLIW